MIPFDPARSRLLVPAPSAGTGSWAGAPGVCREGGDLFVVYRLRRPAPVRGYELRIGAVTAGGVHDVWRVPKEELRSESIERSALVRMGNVWRLYVGYVSTEDHEWRIGLLESPSLDRFDARDVRLLMHPRDNGLSAVKDPWLVRDEGRWYMFVSCGRAVADARFHVGGDALSSGAVKSETGLATSDDGLSWSWQGIVLSASAAGWDRFTSRLTSAVRDGDGWVGCYDGSASLAENYEERCGIARSRDLRSWRRVSTDGPAIGTAIGAGGVRYVAATEQGDVLFEHTRADGAHDLRAILA